ncbi:ATP-binding protein [Ferrovibrio sp.]|uniref:hybrid sensor histidine kinase/response regulator n=1 Tax=Ferrovibrio sp. TaxID=1917215 RepID=UPI0035166631
MHASDSETTRPPATGENDLHAALHAIRYGILLLDAEFRAVFINQAFRRMWRLPDAMADSHPSFAQLLEHGWSQGFYRVQEGDHDRYFAERMAQVERLDGSGQVRLDLQDGRHLLFESVTLPNGQRMLTYADVSPLVEAVQAAESANRAKADFLSGMSHELRTPLNAVIGFAQLLEMQARDRLSAQQAGFVEYIRRGGDHLLRLIDDVLSFAKVDAGKLPVRPEAVRPADLLDDIRPIVMPLAEQAQIFVDWPDPSGFPLLLQADRMRAAQALLNLLSNAVKYSPAGSRVRLECGPGDGMFRIAVHDEGPGIPYDRQGEVFQPFNRLGREAGGIEGSGIGLALTRKLVASMQGRIGFSSRPGEGSCFWIELPLAGRVEEAGPVAATPPPEAKEGEDETGVVLRGGFSLLYIEDNAPNRVLMQHVMATLPDVRYLAAASGAEGLAAARASRPDVIITDINMPDMNGYEVLQHLRAAPETAAIPVLALTSDVHPEAIERGRAAGFDLYITKPVDLAALLRGLDRLLRSRAI